MVLLKFDYKINLYYTMLRKFLFSMCFITFHLVTAETGGTCSSNITKCTREMNLQISDEIKQMSLKYSDAAEQCINIAMAIHEGQQCIEDVTHPDCLTNVRDELNSLATRTAKITQLCTCEKLGAQLTIFKNCVTNLTSPMYYNYFSLCNLVNSYWTCALKVVSGCEFLRYVVSIDDLRVAADLYSCSIGEGYISQKCDYLNMTKCYNNLIQLIPSWKKKFSNMTVWVDFLQPSDDLRENASHHCSNLGTDYQKMYVCGNEEFSLCEQASFKSFEDELGMLPWGTWRWSTVKNYSQYDITDLTHIVTPGLFDLLSDELIMAGQKIAYNLQQVGGVLSFTCADAKPCHDYTERVAEYFACIHEGTTSEYGNDTLELFKRLSIEHVTNHSTPVHCPELKSTRDCAEKHLDGCQMSEAFYGQHHGGIDSYGLASICQATVDFDLHVYPGLCDNEQFVQDEVIYARDRCLPAEIISSDLNLFKNFTSNLCNAFQEQIHCYFQNCKCCECRREVILPRMHTWALITELSKCPEPLLMRSASSSEIYFQVKPLDNACDYQKLLKCYDVILQKAGLNSPTFLGKAELKKILTLKIIFEENTYLCPSKDAMKNMKDCAKKFAEKCKFPEICADGKMPEDQYPLGDFFFHDVINACSKACNGTPTVEATLRRCNIDLFHLNSIDVVAERLFRPDKRSEGTCPSLAAVVNCYRNVMSKCQYKMDKFYDKVGIETIGEDAILRCAEFPELKLSARRQIATSQATKPSGVLTLIGKTLFLILLSGFCY